MKILRFIAVIIAVYCGLTGCQKTRLPEEQTANEEVCNDTTATEKTDSIDGWEAMVDTTFTITGTETN